ncbi:MAG: tetratricopeptide repeat protein [Spirochaetaceae bacterium]|nr:MAG: tetratricopeptide repeat protein [Spirochaetaceae bacterium]
MRLSQSNRHGRRIFTLLTTAVLAVLLGGGVFLILRSRTPILPVLETSRSVDAIELWGSGDYAAVVTVTSRQLEEYPLEETPLALRGFASFYLAMESVDSEEKQTLLIRAVQDLRRVLLLQDPAMETQVRYVLGKAYFHRGSFYYDSAVRELEAARRRGMETLDMLEYLALAHTELRERERAIEYFRAAIRLGDEDVHRVRLADLLIEEGRYEEADALLEAVLGTSGDTLLKQHSLLSLGVSLRKRLRYDDALTRFEELLEVNPSSAEARHQVGETYLEMGENDRARFEWREALRLNPNHIESFQRLQEY